MLLTEKEAEDAEETADLEEDEEEDMDGVGTDDAREPENSTCMSSLSLSTCSAELDLFIPGRHITVRPRPEERTTEHYRKRVPAT